MAEKIQGSETGKQSNVNIWDAKFSSIEVDFTDDGKMVISGFTGLFDDDGNKVAESRPSKSTGKTQVVMTTGGNIAVKTLPSGKTLILGLTAYVK